MDYQIPLQRMCSDAVRIGKSTQLRIFPLLRGVILQMSESSSNLCSQYWILWCANPRHLVVIISHVTTGHNLRRLAVHLTLVVPNQVRNLVPSLRYPFHPHPSHPDLQIDPVTASHPVVIVSRPHIIVRKVLHTRPLTPNLHLTLRPLKAMVVSLVNPDLIIRDPTHPNVLHRMILAEVILSHPVGISRTHLLAMVIGASMSPGGVIILTHLVLGGHGTAPAVLGSVAIPSGVVLLVVQMIHRPVLGHIQRSMMEHPLSQHSSSTSRIMPSSMGGIQRGNVSNSVYR